MFTNAPWLIIISNSARPRGVLKDNECQPKLFGARINDAQDSKNVCIWWNSEVRKMKQNHDLEWFHHFEKQSISVVLEATEIHFLFSNIKENDHLFMI